MLIRFRQPPCGEDSLQLSIETTRSVFFFFFFLQCQGPIRSLLRITQEVGALRNEMGSFRADTHAALTVMCESIAELRGSTKTMNWIVGILATLVVGMFAVDKAPRLLKAMVPADETTPVAAAADLTQ